MGKPLYFSDQVDLLKTRKQVALVFTPTAIKAIATVGIKSKFNEQEECTRGLPETAEFVRGYYDHFREKMVLIFQDESFAELTDGDVIPEISASYTYSWLDN
jgi:hypothetical protein